MQKPPEFRYSSQLELEVGLDHELSDVGVWPAPPNFARQSDVNSTYGPRVDKTNDIGIHTRGYMHIHDASDYLSVPPTAQTKQ